MGKAASLTFLSLMESNKLKCLGFRGSFAEVVGSAGCSVRGARRSSLWCSCVSIVYDSFFFISLRGWVKGLLTFSHFPAIRISHKFLHKPGCSQQWYNPVKFGPISEDFQDILKPDPKFIICPILSCDTSN